MRDVTPSEMNKMNAKLMHSFLERVNLNFISIEIIKVTQSCTGTFFIRKFILTDLL